MTTDGAPDGAPDGTRDGPDRTSAAARPAERLLTRESLAWMWYDLGTTAFNAVVVTFVFSVYLTSPVFGGKDETSTSLGTGLFVAAVIVALFAPVLGHRADRSGRPLAALGFASTVVLVIIGGLFFIRPDPAYLWPGIVALAVATVFSEFAGVHYNALLKRVSTPKTVGRISGFGWGSGYLGSIALLLILLFAFISPDVGLFGVTHADALDIRASMLVTAAWYAVGMVPILIVLRDKHAGAKVGTLQSASSGRRGRESLLGAYRALWHTIRRLARTAPETLKFLIASAIFRDGLVGVFAFGGVIAAGTFGFSPAQVVVFAVVANLIAGIATVSLGVLDDLIGPRRVIIASLALMIAAGVGIFALHDRGPMVFWVLGLALCIFVGPAQSASRSLLARQIPPGLDGEVFGLYQTSGRALSFMAPAAFTGSIALGRALRPDADSTQYWGILGIMAVLLVGLIALLFVRPSSSRTMDPTWT